MIHQTIQILYTMLDLIFKIIYFCMNFFYSSMYSKCLGSIKQYIYHFFLNLFYPKDLVIVSNKFSNIFSNRFSNSLWGSDILPFSEFINIVSFLFYNFIDFIILLYIFLVISLSRYKEYIICLISFSKFYLLLLGLELLPIFEAFV